MPRHSANRAGLLVGAAVLELALRRKVVVDLGKVASSERQVQILRLIVEPAPYPAVALVVTILSETATILNSQFPIEPPLQGINLAK